MLFDRLAADDRPRIAELPTLLRAAAKDIEQDDPSRATHLRQLATNLLREDYPDGRGAVLISRKRIDQDLNDALPVLDDGDDQLSRSGRDKPVALADHTAHVVSAVDRALSLLPTEAMADAFRVAAKLHDLGKADERFQAMLRRTDRTDAWLLSGETSVLLAKSDGLPQTRSEGDAARKRAGLPAGFRHEMLSIQLAERSSHLPDDATERDLILHLIAAHHGYARPFAPVVFDNDPADPPPDVCVEESTIATADRLDGPPHRLDSGIAERFWSLTRRYGWWGLAYLETILRLSDQQASAAEDAGTTNDESARLVEAST
jgi:CRISPR-associated endonuclease/helicase Cas3